MSICLLLFCVLFGNWALALNAMLLERKAGNEFESKQKRLGKRGLALFTVNAIIEGNKAKLSPLPLIWL